MTHFVDQPKFPSFSGVRILENEKLGNLSSIIMLMNLSMYRVNLDQAHMA